MLKSIVILILSFALIITLFGFSFAYLRDRLNLIFLNSDFFDIYNLFLAKIHILLTVIIDFSIDILLVSFDILIHLLHISFKLVNGLE